MKNKDTTNNDRKIFKIELPDNLSKTQLEELLGEVKLKISQYDKPSTDIHITCLLDISGSMSSIREDSIGGFNTFLQQQQESKIGNAFLTVHLFDNKFETLYENLPIHDVKPLTAAQFVPRGSTALTDALGKTLTDLLAVNNKNNIIVILTDGGENASKTFTAESVRKLTTQCEEKNWQFIYLGANQDSFSVTSNYGITKGFTANYVASAVGTRAAYASASSSTMNSRSRMVNSADIKAEESKTE